MTVTVTCDVCGFEAAVETDAEDFGQPPCGDLPSRWGWLATRAPGVVVEFTPLCPACAEVDDDETSAWPWVDVL